MRNNVIQMRKGQPMTGSLLLFEDHRATSTMHASVTMPSSGESDMPDTPCFRATLIGLVLRLLVVSLAVLATGSQASPFTALTSKLSTNISDLPRYERLPLFKPHRETFICIYQDQHVPPIDPQAELWFQQALALDDPNIYPAKRDWS
ncbi:hypothetical protein [Paraburkholderia sp. NMBU_R16]|uniref:hypothetical protein n=1 Tax=Paraburkholderia sp. NMBU_R16 TaxID=2698676 RepID=UPI0020B7CA76|nr:hypothetical protein [Paraburkholderia sp. NMBU_R16]